MYIDKRQPKLLLLLCCLHLFMFILSEYFVESLIYLSEKDILPDF